MARLITKNNISAGTTPAAGTLDTGELGVNVIDRKLYTHNGTSNVRIDGAYIDSVMPTHGTEGDLWYDTANNMLKTHNGSTWVAAGYTTLGEFGITATAAELNILDGATLTTAELNFVDGVTSNIQTQLDGKATSGHNHTLDALSNTTITTNTAGEILKWSGTAWVNNTLAEAGIAASGHTHAGVYEPADATILKDADIGVTVQAHSAVLDGTTASFTTAEETKLAGIEAGADVTDTANVSAAGALMKTGGTVTGTVHFNSADLKMDVGDVYMADGMKTYYGTSNDLVIAHDGTTSYIHNSSASLEFESWQDHIFDINGWEKFKIHGTGANVTGDIAVTGTVDGRDVAADGTKLDGIEAGADVTDTANVTAAGALMDSELTNEAAVKAINQQLTLTSDVEFNSLHLEGNLTVNGTTTTVNSNEVNIGDSVILLNSDEIGVPTQNAGFEVERGTSANVSFLWNETNDYWDMGGHNLDNVVIDGGSF